MIKEAIGKLMAGNSLAMGEAASVMEEIMDGKATPAQLGAFLTALTIKEETAEEIAGLASVMRAKATRVTVSYPVVDVVGTGGDGMNTFNISTAAAFVVAGAGLKVAKHGNRAASSLCGSADVLEALGVKISLDAEQVRQCIEQAGIGFMFAQLFHPAMKYASGPRKELGFRTIFNVLGPLTNPADAQFMVVGVPNRGLGTKMISALRQMNIRHALVVHGLNGYDELSITGASLMWETREGEIIAFEKRILPGHLRLEKGTEKDITGGTPAENAAILHAVLDGEKGPRRDVVLMNAAAALLAGDKVNSIVDGVELAARSIDSGAALTSLEKLVKISRSYE